MHPDQLVPADEAQQVPVDVEALARARMLQRKRDEGRQQASKAQLKKARRKLSKLYHKALGHDDPSSSKPPSSSAGVQHADIADSLLEPAPLVQATLTDSFSGCSQPISQHSTLFPPEPACSSMGGAASPSEHTGVHPCAPTLQAASASKLQQSTAQHALPLTSHARKKSRHARMGDATSLQGSLEALPQGHVGGVVGGGVQQPDQHALPEASESSVRGHAGAAVGGAGAQGPRSIPHPGAVRGHPAAPNGQADLSNLFRLLQAELPPSVAALTAQSTDSSDPAASGKTEVQGQANAGLQQGPTQEQRQHQRHQQSQHHSQQKSHHQQKKQEVPQPVQQQQQQQQQGQQQGQQMPHHHHHHHHHQQQQQQQRGHEKPKHQQFPQGQQPQKKKPMKSYIYGNYHGYYGYRHTAAFEDDPRLCLLRPEWFEGRHMLDVGCNEGLVTLAVAAQFNCASTTGVDIDRDLISKACRNLRRMRTDVAEQIREAGAGISKPTVPASLTHPQPQSASSARSGSRSATPSRNVGATQTQQEQQQRGHHHHQQQQQQRQQQLLLQVAGSSPSPSDSLASGGWVGPGATADTIPHAAGLGARAYGHGTGGREGSAPGHVTVPKTVDAGTPEVGLKAPERAPGSAGGHITANATGSGGGFITDDVRVPKKAPGQLSPWERLRRAAHVLSRAQFKTCDWANEGDPEEFVLSQASKSSKRRRGRDRYGVITCLSVTKWVHLNWGDAGLMRLFTKIWNSLEPGGLLVLEPQPWRSYCQVITKKQTSAVPFRNLEALRLRPEAFITTLTDIGFQLLANLNEGSTAIGFSRPMYVLLKPSSPTPRTKSTALVALTEQQQEQQQRQQQQQLASLSGAASLEGQQRDRRRQGKGSSKLHAASASSSQQTGRTCSKSSGGSKDYRRQPQPEDLLDDDDDDDEEDGAPISDQEVEDA